MFHPHTINTMSRRRALRRAGWIAAGLGALLTMAAGAQVSRTIEECVESGTSLVNLPGIAGGTLTASACSGCPSVRLSFDGETQYFIGKEVVTYAKLREAAAKGDLRLDIFYKPQTRTLTRLRLAATGVGK